MDQSCEASGLERSTVDQYRQHLDLHIVPFIGKTLLSKLTVPSIRQPVQDKLREEGRSPAMVKRVTVSPRRNIGRRTGTRACRPKFGPGNGQAAAKGRERQGERRQKARLRVGVDIPTAGRG